MSLGKSSARQRSATRRNRSQSHQARDSTSSETANAPPETRSRSLRGLRPPSRTGRASISSASSFSRPRSPDSNARSSNRPRPAPSPTTTTHDLWQPRSGSLSTPATSQTSPSPADETRDNCPNGSHASPTGAPYSTPRTTDPGTNPMRSNYSPSSPSRTPPQPTASPDASSTPSPPPPHPPTP